MQLGLVRLFRFALSVLIVLMVSGCGQKGPLYREAPVPDAVPSEVSDTAAVDAREQSDEGNEKP